MERTKKAYYILVVVDVCLEFVWLYPAKDTGTEAVTSRLSKQAAILGNLSRFVTDGGAACTGKLFKG